jgi:hypothetical protein
LPVRVFFAIAIISAFTLVVPVWNYSKFYIAWNRLDYTVAKVTIVNASQAILTNKAQINVTLLVTNPTDYSGLNVVYITCDVEYLWINHTVYQMINTFYVIPTISPLWDLNSVKDGQTHPLGPNSQITIPLTLSLSTTGGSAADQDVARSFISFLKSKQAERPTQIQWFLSCDLVAGTFLGNIDVGSKYFQSATPLS